MVSKELHGKLHELELSQGETVREEPVADEIGVVFGVEGDGNDEVLWQEEFKVLPLDNEGECLR